MEDLVPGGVKSSVWWGKAEQEIWFFLKLWIFGWKYQKMLETSFVLMVSILKKNAKAFQSILE